MRIRFIIPLLLCLVFLGGAAAADEFAVDLRIDPAEPNSGWRMFGSGLLEATTEQVRTGSRSLKVTGRRDGWHSPAFDVDAILADGGAYKFSIYVRLVGDVEEEVSGHFIMGENYKDGRTEYQWLCENVPLSSEEWTLIESDWYIYDGENMSNAWLYVEVTHPTASFYIDDFRLVGDKKAAAQQSLIGGLPSLREAFADYFLFGAATSPRFLDDNSLYGPFVAHHYGVLVAGNEMKPDALQPIEGRFNWREADRFVDFAQKNNMLVRGHTLLWHNQVPDWFFQDPNDRSQMASRELLIERLETHVKTVVGKYKGQIYSWDVVNEVLNDRGEIRGINDDSKWKAIIGDADGDGYDSDYIELAFKFAREADPDAQLIINDYGLESRGMKRTGMYNLVKRMLEKGIPVDGVGLQMHINVFTPSVYEIEEAIELFASLKEYNPDFTVLVTEMDMSVYRWMEGKKEITDELLELQAQRYAEIFAMFKRQAEKGNLSTVVMWGLGDADSWLENFPIRGRGDAGLLFDKQFQPKPAFFRLLELE